MGDVTNVQPDRRVVVHDELSGVSAGTAVRWQMATRATISVSGRIATLRQDGKVLTVEALAPADATFQAQSAEPPADVYNAHNVGVQLLSLTAAAPADGPLKLEVALTPVHPIPK